MLSYYPEYKGLLEHKDSYFSDCEGRDLYIYVDVKNACKAVFLESYIHDVYDQICTSGKLEISTFSSMISYIIRLRKFFINTMKFKSVKFIFFLDQGKSIYHRHILKKYKESRLILQSTVNPKILDGFTSNLKLNYDLCHKILNRLEDVYFIYLKNIESDFIPHYLIKYYFTDSDNYHIIMSTDKDMYQTLNLTEHTFQYIKNNRSINPHVLIRNKSIISYLLKDPNTKYSNLYQAIELIMAMVGDAGDDIPGIFRVHYKTAVKYVDVLLNKVGLSIDEIKIKIFKKEKIEIDTKTSDISKAVQVFNDNLDILYNSYRLISYDCLIDYLNIVSGKKNDEYNFNYGLQAELDNIFFKYIDNILTDKKHKIKLSYEQFINMLKKINGVVAWNNANINIEELREYFNMFGTI